MGEYAEMMLDGTCCACCGEYLGTDAGFPIYCGGCARDFNQEPLTGLPITKHKAPKLASEKRFACGDCGKKFASKGARKNHRRDAHAPSSHPTQEDRSDGN